MPFSHLPSFLTSAFAALACWLDRRSAARLPLLLCGILFATGRRTVTSWFRAAGINDDFRPAYTTVCAVGRQADHMALSTLDAIKPLLDPRRLRGRQEAVPASGPPGRLGRGRPPAQGRGLVRAALAQAAQPAGAATDLRQAAAVPGQAGWTETGLAASGVRAVRQEGDQDHQD